MPVLAADRDRRDDWFHLYTLRQRISPAAIVEEAGKFANEVIAQLNRVGDTHGALFKDGAVTMPPGWKEAYRNWAAAGWNGLSAPVEWGGQGAPLPIDGEPYWDGGYVGNPTITPLVRECTSSDTVLIQVNPVERPGRPRSAREILDRFNEVSFNSPLMKELRLIAVLRQVADTGACEGARWAASYRQLHDDRARLLLEAQCRVGVLLYAARRRPPMRADVPERSCAGFGPPLHLRSRFAAGKCLTRWGSSA